MPEAMFEPAASDTTIPVKVIAATSSVTGPALPIATSNLRTSATLVVTAVEPSPFCLIITVAVLGMGIPSKFPVVSSLAVTCRLSVLAAPSHLSTVKVSVVLPLPPVSLLGWHQVAVSSSKVNAQLPLETTSMASVVPPSSFTATVTDASPLTVIDGIPPSSSLSSSEHALKAVTANAAQNNVFHKFTAFIEFSIN